MMFNRARGIVLFSAAAWLAPRAAGAAPVVLGGRVTLTPPPGWTLDAADGGIASGRVVFDSPDGRASAAVTILPPDQPADPAAAQTLVTRSAAALKASLGAGLLQPPAASSDPRFTLVMKWQFVSAGTTTDAMRLWRATDAGTVQEDVQVRTPAAGNAAAGAAAGPGPAGPPSEQLESAAEDILANATITAAPSAVARSSAGEDYLTGSTIGKTGDGTYIVPVPASFMASGNEANGLTAASPDGSIRVVVTILPDPPAPGAGKNAASSAAAASVEAKAAAAAANGRADLTQPLVMRDPLLPVDLQYTWHPIGGGGKSAAAVIVGRPLPSSGTNGVGVKAHQPWVRVEATADDVTIARPLARQVALGVKPSNPLPLAVPPSVKDATKYEERARVAMSRATTIQKESAASARPGAEFDAYKRFLSVAASYPGTAAANQAITAAAGYESDPVFISRHGPEGAGDAAGTSGAAGSAADAASSLAMADNYRQAGNSDKAREMYEKIIKSYATSPAAAKAKQRLAELK